MTLLDSNIFIIDRFFKGDLNYQINRKFISLFDTFAPCVSFFSLLELCGIASFNLSAKELKKWLFHFDEVYEVTILEPKVDLGTPVEDWFWAFTRGIVDRIVKKMTFCDALLLKDAEEYDAETIVTWNKKHFEDRTKVKILTPKDFLKEQNS